MASELQRVRAQLLSTQWTLGLYIRSARSRSRSPLSAGGAGEHLIRTRTHRTPLTMGALDKKQRAESVKYKYEYEYEYSHSHSHSHSDSYFTVSKREAKKPERALLRLISDFNELELKREHSRVYGLGMRKNWGN